MRRISRALLFAALLRAAPALAQSPDPVAPSCAEAAAIAEREAGVPGGLLLAIGRVESGRYDPASGRIVPWPWTTNAAGVGHYFDTRDDAVAWLRDAQLRGLQSVDVGCFQVNLMYHPEAFAAPEDGFEPLANARAAAGFLAQLYARTGGWESAVAMYHSAVPERGGPYRDLVLARWTGGDLGAMAGPATGTAAARPSLLLAAARPGAADPYVVLVSARASVRSWMPAVWTPDGPLRGAAHPSGRLPRVITP